MEQLLKNGQTHDEATQGISPTEAVGGIASSELKCFFFSRKEETVRIEEVKETHKVQEKIKLRSLRKFLKLTRAISPMVG